MDATAAPFASGTDLSTHQQLSPTSVDGSLVGCDVMLDAGTRRPTPMAHGRIEALVDRLLLVRAVGTTVPNMFRATAREGPPPLREAALSVPLARSVTQRRDRPC